MGEEDLNGKEKLDPKRQTTSRRGGGVGGGGEGLKNNMVLDRKEKTEQGEGLGEGGLQGREKLDPKWQTTSRRGGVGGEALKKQFRAQR